MDIMPGPVERPDLYSGIVTRRAIAYLVDFAIIAILGVIGWFILGIAGILTFGLLWGVMPVFGVLLPICYHGFLIGGSRAATLGMQIMGIHVRRLDGTAPTMLQAFILSSLFYGTVALTSFLILLVVFFNPRRRSVHDWLSGVVVVNRQN